MKISNVQLISLQREWYDLLAQEGFEDIEVGDELKRFDSCLLRYLRIDKRESADRNEYFRFLSQKVQDQDTSYRNEIDKHILTRFADGAKIKIIVDELNAGYPPLRRFRRRDRKSIRIIIRRYEMAWGIKNYTRKQLNVK